MKKFFALVLALAALLSFAACGKTQPARRDVIASLGGLNYKALSDSVWYVEANVLESDPGENITAEQAAQFAWEKLYKGKPRADAAQIFLALQKVEYLDLPIHKGDIYVFAEETGLTFNDDSTVQISQIGVDYDGGVYRQDETLVWEKNA